MECSLKMSLTYWSLDGNINIEIFVGFSDAINKKSVSDGYCLLEEIQQWTIVIGEEIARIDGSDL